MKKLLCLLGLIVITQAGSHHDNLHYGPPLGIGGDIGSIGPYNPNVKLVKVITLSGNGADYYCHNGKNGVVKIVKFLYKNGAHTFDDGSIGPALPSFYDFNGPFKINDFPPHIDHPNGHGHDHGFGHHGWL